jgi:rod shape-determining protein MreC
VNPLKGDTIVTSGFNAVFPEGIFIGIIEKVNPSKEGLFYDLDVKLIQDFRKISFVTVIKSTMKHEQDSLEQIVTPLQR